MKKIVPFNNILEMDTDVCEITAISLEHEFKAEEDTISGVFFITGEYKITDGQIETDKFNFELPFDIALGCNYNLDTLVVDIDDFRYELIDRNKLKINIDLYIDGEVIEHPLKVEENISEEDKLENNNMLDDREEVFKEEPEVNEKIEVVDKLTDDLEDNMKDIDINIDNINMNENQNDNKEENNQEINLFNGFNEEEKYVTYRVYRVTDGDTIDKIIEKYNVTKEELAKYNDISDIKTGDKLIIPAND